MSGGLVAAMVAAYPDPRAAMSRVLREGEGEERALFYLFAACGLAFVASLPTAIRNASVVPSEGALSITFGAHLFGFLFIAPLLMYGIAALVHLGARAFGARGPYLRARMALFWSLLLGAPIALGVALIGVAAELALGPNVLPWLGGLRYAGLAVWLWIFAASLAEAEGFAHSGRVAVAIVAGFGGVAALIALMLGGPAVAVG